MSVTDKLQIIIVNVPMNNDFCFTTLETNIEQFFKIFSIAPDTLNVGVDNVFNVFRMFHEKFDKKLIKKYKLKALWVSCKKDFPDYYWELETFDIPKMMKYILYSNGA